MAKRLYPEEDVETRKFEKEMCDELHSNLSVKDYVDDQTLKNYVDKMKQSVNEYFKKRKESALAKIEELSKEKKPKVLTPEEWGSYLIKKAWMTYRGRDKSFKLNAFRLNLYGFASFLLGKSDASKIRLPLLPVRRLVVPLQQFEEVNLDIAHELLWKVRTMVPSNTRKNKLWGLSRLFLELLWQGVRMNEALRLKPLSFDPKRRLLFVPYLKGKNGYRIVVIAQESWIFMKGPLRRLRNWSTKTKDGNLLSLGDEIGKASAATLVRKLLKEAASSLKIEKKYQPTLEQFRIAGIMHRMLMEDLSATEVCASHGPELPTNVISPISIYKPKMSS